MNGTVAGTLAGGPWACSICGETVAARAAFVQLLIHLPDGAAAEKRAHLACLHDQLAPGGRLARQMAAFR